MKNLRRQRVCVVALLATVFSGCSAWFSASEPLPTVLGNGPEQVRIILEDETRLTLLDPALDMDVAVGTARECGALLIMPAPGS